MIANGGRCRIITSVQVDNETYAALEESRKRPEEAILDLPYSFNDSALLQGQLEKDYYSLFVALLKSGSIELKIAVTANNGGILHEKIGIVEDEEGKALSFSGSNNETVHGWAVNTEEFKVFPEWDISTAEFYKQDKNKFEDYWNDRVKSVRIVEIDDALKEKVFNVGAIDYDVNRLIGSISDQESGHAAGVDLAVGVGKVADRNLRAYQLAAIDHWKESDYVSIFEMATGTGKTFTSINALQSFKKDKGFLHCIIVVPLVTLVEQWKTDIASNISDVLVITASSANNNWKRDLRSLNISYQLGNEADFIVITTYATFSSEVFKSFVDSCPDDVVLVTDEMHNLVTNAGLKSATNPNYKYKLGLSATPTRLWKQEESALALSLFGNKPYVYSLEKAIENDFLVPYSYFISPVYLTVEEYEEYATLSKEISKLSAYHKSDEPSSAYSMALTKRAKIKKQAENKLHSLDNLVKKLRKFDLLKNTLIYVDSNAFLGLVQLLLTENHIKSTKFTGSETLEERIRTIEQLRAHKIDAIIAIKCLDEGVDIPSASNGIFLSNNTDPREYVQRLGRVLRRDDKSGKQQANVYDYIVLPPSNVDRGETIGRNLVKGELIRANFFKSLCLNQQEVSQTIGSIMDNYGYYFEEDELSYNQQEETI